MPDSPGTADKQVARTRGLGRLWTPRAEILAVVMTLLVGIVGWLLDSFVHSQIHNQGTFLEMALTDIPRHALQVRAYACVSFALLGLGLYLAVGRLRRSRERIERANTILRAVHEASHEHGSPERIIQRICDTYCRSPEFLFAWGVLFDSSGRVESHATSEKNVDFETMFRDWASGVVPECAARLGDPPRVTAWVSATHECAECPATGTVDLACRTMTVPIDIGRRRHGVIGVVARSQTANDAEERALLETVARDVAALLASNEAEAVRSSSESALLRSEQYNRELARNLDKQLREAEYRHIWDMRETSPVPAATIDTNGRVLDYNDAMAELTGYAREEIQDTRAWLALLHPDEQERESSTAIMSEVLTGHTRIARQSSVIHNRAGDLIVAEFTATPVLHNGEPTGVILVEAVDITEEEATREALAWESEVNLALAVLSGSLLRTRSLSEFAKAVLKTGKRLTHSEHGYVASIDPDSFEVIDHTTPETGRDARETQPWDNATELRPDENGEYPSLRGHSLNTRAAFYTNEPGSHESFSGAPDEHVPPENFISAPAIVDGKLVGQIAMAGAKRGYTDRDLSVTKRLADLFALAVQRDRDQLKLEAERDRAKNYLDTAGSVLLAIDQDERVSMINRAGCRLLGCTEEEALGANWIDTFLPPYRREDVRKLLRKMLSGHVKPSEVVEDEVLTKSGEVRWVSWSNALRYGPGGEVVGTLSSGEDVTDRKWHSDLLRSLNSTALAVEQAMDTMSVFEAVAAELRHLDFHCAIFGFDASSDSLSYRHTSLGDRTISLIERVTGLKRDEYLLDVSSSSLLKRVVRRSETILCDSPGELTQDLLPGATKRVAGKVADMLKLPQIALTPIIVGEDVIGMFTVLSRRLTDSDLPTITAFSSILAAGWRKTDLLAELRASVKELENTQSKLAQAQKMEAIGKLAGGVAHDFNNLLTVITGYTDILLGSVDDEGVRAHAEEVRNASQRAAELTQQLLAFSRQQPLEPRIIEGNSAVTSVSSLLRRLIGEDIALSVNLSPETGFIRVDPTQLEQVLMNLAVNARDAMPDGGALTIATDLAEVTVDEAREHDGVAPGTYMRLTVSDTGTGISKDSLDRLFEPFFSTKELGRGTGLGLSVVYGVVRQHGGFIEVDSELKKGTTFHVYLPSAAPESSEKHGAPKESAPPTGSGQRILLVEDDETVRIVTSQMLELSGYEVTAVEDTTQALAALDTSSPFDLVFTDIVLPDRSGVWLAEHLAETRPDVRILVGTGYTDDRSRGQVVTDLGLDFIRKPYEAGELMRTVHGVLARPN